MKLSFKNRKDQLKKTSNARIDETTSGGAETVRVGSKWMRVVSARKEEKVTALIRPVEYFSTGADQEFQSAAQHSALKAEDGAARFIHVAMTHAESKPPVPWRKTKKFIDRNVAIADFDTYLCAAGYHYDSGLIAYEAWTVWVDDCRCIDFSLWRGVLEITRKSKCPKFPESDWGCIKLWAVDLKSLEEIEEATKSLLSAPAPKILDHLEAPVRLVPV